MWFASVHWLKTSLYVSKNNNNNQHHEDVNLVLHNHNSRLINFTLTNEKENQNTVTLQTPQQKMNCLRLRSVETAADVGQAGKDEQSMINLTNIGTISKGTCEHVWWVVVEVMWAIANAEYPCWPNWTESPSWYGTTFELSSRSYIP